MQIGFSSWWPLVLLLLVPLGGWLAFRSRRGMERWRFWTVHLLRSGSIVCVIAALCGPVAQTPSDAVSVVYALDVSHSVAPHSVRSAVEWMRDVDTRFQPAHSRFVVFADRAQLLSRIEDIETVRVGDSPNAATVTLDRGATDLEAGVAAALSGFRPGHARRLVLITDGNQTRGDVWRQLPRLLNERVRVHAVPVPAGNPADAWIESLDTPDHVRTDEPVSARVRLMAATSLRGRIEVRVKDEPRLRRDVALEAGRNDIDISLRFLRAGENSVKITFTTPEGRSDSFVSSVWAGPRLKLLHVEGGRAGSQPLADALAANGIDVRALSAARFTDDPDGALKDMDAVLLSDVSADALSEQATGGLQRFVRDQGGGLVFVAGENTYGKSGFSGGVVEGMLPVRFEARRKRNELDLVLLLDRSHSMRGDRIELAKTAALATLDMMEPQHRLAVVAFDSRPHDVVPLAKVGTKRRAEDAIGTITTGGRTDVYNALWRANELLKDSESRIRHVILLTDGQSAPPPNAGAAPKAESSIMRTLESLLQSQGQSAERTRKLLNVEGPDRPAAAAGGYDDLVAKMAADGITLSTVAIGDEPNLVLLASLAAQGNGKTYVARRDSEIPGLFVTEARRLLGDALVEEPFRPRIVGSSDVLTGVDFSRGPELKGFVTTRPKRFADVLLEAEGKAPLLVETRYGLGKTVAFLSDAKNRWARDWLSWEGYGKFWSQVIRDAARSRGGQLLAWEVERKEGDGMIRLTALDADGAYRNELWPKVEVTRPDGQRSVVVLRQTSLGTYTASVPLRPSTRAPYRFELLPGPGLTPADIATVHARTLYYPAVDEFRARPADLSLLKSLSERTGGQFAPGTDRLGGIFSAGADGGQSTTELWPALAGIALLLVLMEIAARRVPLPARLRTDALQSSRLE
ncbi:MAG: VWA domain-containing protein [Betaproteobacteria bacterium]|nr:VWA domain-containing protein [Betaproteobacteria bacterium]